MSDLQVARLTSRIKRLYRLGRGEGPVLPEIEDVLYPVSIIEPFQPEHYYLGAEHLAAGTASQVMALGDFAVFRIINPLGSGMLVTVEEIAMFDDRGATLPMELRHAFVWTAPVAGATFWRDQRIGDVVNRTVAQVQSQVVAALSGTVFWREPQIFGGTGAVTRLPLILAPDNDYVTAVIALAAAGAALGQCSFAWRERAIEASER